MKINQTLLLAARNIKNLRLFKYAWSAMGIKHDTLDKFKKLVNEKDEKGYNVIQLAVIYNKLEIIQWIFEKLKRDVLSDEELRKFMKNKANDGRNILQLAAACNKNSKTHEWLWNEIVKMYGKDGLKEMIENGDQSDRNVFHLAALSNTNEIFTKLYSLAKLHVGAQDMRKSLRKKELVYDQNVFDIAKEHATDSTIHQWLKTKRHKYF